MYRSEAPKALVKYFNVLELTLTERTRIFNLGYYTWVEQRGVSLDAFMVRAQPKFWRSIRRALDHWDRSIEELNGQVRVAGHA
jgi:cysteine synthase A